MLPDAHKLTSLEDAYFDDFLRGCWAVAWQFLTAFNGFDNIHAFGNFAKHGVVSVEPRSGYRGEEELGAACVFASVSHREDAWLVVLQTKRRCFAWDLPAWSTSARSSGHWVFGMWAAALNHEVFNYTVEVKAVVVAHLDQTHEISNRIGGASVVEFDGDVSCAGFHKGVHDSTRARGVMSIRPQWVQFEAQFCNQGRKCWSA